MNFRRHWWKKLFNYILRPNKQTSGWKFPQIFICLSYTPFSPRLGAPVLLSRASCLWRQMSSLVICVIPATTRGLVLGLVNGFRLKSMLPSHRGRQLVSYRPAHFYWMLRLETRLWRWKEVGLWQILYTPADNETLQERQFSISKFLKKIDWD